MTNNTQRQPTVIRTQRGLSISGTRITLYDIMDHVVGGWSQEAIRDILSQ